MYKSPIDKLELKIIFNEMLIQNPNIPQPDFYKDFLQIENFNPKRLNPDCNLQDHSFNQMLATRTALCQSMEINQL